MNNDLQQGSLLDLIIRCRLTFVDKIIVEIKLWRLQIFSDKQMNIRINMHICRNAKFLFNEF